MQNTLTTLKRTSLATGAWLAATLLLAAPVAQTYVEMSRGLL